MLIYGVALTMVQTATTTLIQEKAEASTQGRVFGLMGSMYSGFLPIGMAVFRPLADVIPLQWVMRIFVDKETGVQYLLAHWANVSGLTVLVDMDGKPLLDPRYAK